LLSHGDGAQLSLVASQDAQSLLAQADQLNGCQIVMYV